MFIIKILHSAFYKMAFIHCFESLKVSAAWSDSQDSLCSASVLLIQRVTELETTNHPLCDSKTAQLFLQGVARR